MPSLVFLLQVRKQQHTGQVTSPTIERVVIVCSGAAGMAATKGLWRKRPSLCRLKQHASPKSWVPGM
jgi:hypothetical protein